MKTFLITLLFLFLILILPFATIVAIVAIPFVFVYKMKELKLGKIKPKTPSVFDFIIQNKDKVLKPKTQ